MMRLTRCVAAAAAVVLLGTGCGGEADAHAAGTPSRERTVDTSFPAPTDGDRATDADRTRDGEPGQEPLPEPTASEDDVPDPEIEELVEDYEAATELVGGFWERSFEDHFTGEYVTPALPDFGVGLAGVYDATEGRALCAGEVLEADNAYYCPDEHALAFSADLLVTSNAEIGDSFVYMLVAHEWGHAVAAHVDEGEQTVADELTADCLAGAALYGLVDEGLLELEEGDVKEITNGLTDVADDSPWGDADDHGDPFERILAFDAGKEGSVQACFA